MKCVSEPFRAAGSRGHTTEQFYDRPVEQLLERDDELGSLVAAFEAACAGRGSLILVGGEAGSGKSSLIRGLRECVGDRGAFVVVGCESLSVPLPLAPVRELAAAVGAPG